jgi:hypothetical protein
VKKIFISYRRADPDMALATFLDQSFASAGFEVFRDIKTPIGARWAQEIQAALDTCDYFVILLSEQSMDRDMVRQETQRVHGLAQKLGKPVILPVRLAYTGALPYDMAAWLDPLQYALWWDETDNARIAAELIAAINNLQDLPHKLARTSEDQKALLAATEGVGRPLPKAEPVLDVIGMSADNPFYIEREVDRFFYDSLRWDNGVATLHAARQMGKSSLIARVRSRLEREGMKSAFLDLKLLANESLNSAPEALEGLAGLISDQLDIQTDPASFFSGRGFVGQKWQKFLVKAVAPVAERVVLLFDDIDSLFGVPYRDAFFGCIRAVIDQKAQVPELQKIAFGFAHSHDPGLWIKMAHQSPFNVAKVLPLLEFSREQFNALHERHGSCLKNPKDAQKLFQMLGGHPYLTRVALYRLARKELTLAELEAEAATDEGLFGDHLRARLISVINANLAKPFKSILDSGKCGDIMQFQALLAMGLVRGESHKKAAARFGLYLDYFQPRLDA